MDDIFNDNMLVARRRNHWWWFGKSPSVKLSAPNSGHLS
jgi:hypothetical protein